MYSNGNGTLLVKMLYNENETDFKADCDGANTRREATIMTTRS